jgi:hypothetical protein
VNRPFRFQKCCQDFFSSHDETLSVAMRVSNPDRSPASMIPLPKCRIIRHNSRCAIRSIIQGKVRYAHRSFKGELRRRFRFRVQKRNRANAPAGMEPRFKGSPKLSSHSSRNCLLRLRCTFPLCVPSLSFVCEILSTVTSHIRAIVRTWIYADRILSGEADSTIYGRNFHGAQLDRSSYHVCGDAPRVTGLEK